MLAKAVAHHTSAAYIAVVGSEFVQKYLGKSLYLSFTVLNAKWEHHYIVHWFWSNTCFFRTSAGEGPRMVRDVFRLAKENAPAIIFIDEIDAIATKRFDAQTGADREVQRILLELLNQMDGFDQSVNVKVIRDSHVTMYLFWPYLPNINALSQQSIGDHGDKQSWHVGSCIVEAWSFGQKDWIPHTRPQAEASDFLCHHKQNEPQRRSWSRRLYGFLFFPSFHSPSSCVSYTTSMSLCLLRCILIAFSSFLSEKQQMCLDLISWAEQR